MNIIDLIEAPIRVWVESFFNLFWYESKNKYNLNNSTLNNSNLFNYKKNYSFNKNKKTWYWKEYPNFIPSFRTYDIWKLNEKIKNLKF